MTTFSELPNEILYEILGLAGPEDLENFAQISKRVQELASPLLRGHRLLIRNYHTFDNWIYGHAAVISLLEGVLTTPQIGQYVREAKVHFIGDFYDPVKYTEPEIEFLCKIAAESKHVVSILDATAVLSLQADIKNHCQSAPLALLLPLLPNLETLQMEENWASPGFWVSKIVSNAPKAANPFLTKLAHVQLRPNNLDGNNYRNSQLLGAKLEHLRPYAALPSVKELFAPDLTCGLYYRGNDLPPQASAVTKLELLGIKDQLDAKDLCSFLKDFSNLEVFDFSTSPDISDSMFDASLIKNTLLATVSATLRTLTILGPTKYSGFIGSLRNFQVLKELHTDWSLLVRNNCNLQAVLPVSLHHLELDDNKVRSKYVYKRLMKKALSGKLLGVLQLEHVTLTTPECKQLDETYRSLRQKCSEKGLILTVRAHVGI